MLIRLDLFFFQSSLFAFDPPLFSVRPTLLLLDIQCRDGAALTRTKQSARGLKCAPWRFCSEVEVGSSVPPPVQRTQTCSSLYVHSGPPAEETEAAHPLPKG